MCRTLQTYLVCTSPAFYTHLTPLFLQVKALYAFTGQGISMAKGEVMFLINKTNPDWWSVRKADRTDGFVPANYVREIEPRVVPVSIGFVAMFFFFKF